MSPVEIHEFYRKQDDYELSELKQRWRRSTSPVEQRTLELQIEQVEDRIRRRSDPAHLAYVEAEQAKYERQQRGDVEAQRAAQERYERDKELRNSESYRRKWAEYVSLI